MYAWIRKASWVLVLGLLVSQSATGQEFMTPEGPSCVLQPREFQGEHVYIPPDYRSQRYLDELEEYPDALTGSSITISWVGAGGMDIFGNTCSAAPSLAMTAFTTAATMWEVFLVSTPPIVIEACWASLGGPLAIGGSFLVAGFVGSVPMTFYQMPLANSIATIDLNGGTVEGGVTFESTLYTWDYTLLTPASTDFSFISVALHELGHTLGFSGGGSYGTAACGGPTTGCIPPAGFAFPLIYDRFTEDGVVPTPLLSYANPSIALGTALTGGFGGVFFSGTATDLPAPAGPKALHAPVVWAGGSSYSHFDGVAVHCPTCPFPELMNPFSMAGTAIFSLGTAIDVLDDEGWVTKIPVELTSFTATADGEGVMLRWETSSETNNAGFEVEMVGPVDEAFVSAGFVEGHGTTTEVQNYTFRVDELSPGTYTFRLHQVDFDGQTEYSPEVEATVEVPDGYMLAAPYPNPFNPEAVVEFAVADSRPVRIELFNVLGQQVAVLFDGIPEAGQTQRVRIDGRRLPSGAYLVRLIGENIMATQRVTLVK